MLNDVAVAVIAVLILAVSFGFAFCHDCITVRRHRAAGQKATTKETRADALKTTSWR